jgi:hypothetical protein
MSRLGIGGRRGFRSWSRFEEIHELLRRDPKLSGVRVRELIEPLGFDGSKTEFADQILPNGCRVSPDRTAMQASPKRAVVAGGG